MNTFEKVDVDNTLSHPLSRPLCRPGCGACCIAPSISTLNKPAGVPCMHLTENYACSIFESIERPGCCAGLKPSEEMCGSDRNAALNWLNALEEATKETATTPRTSRDS